MNIIAVLLFAVIGFAPTSAAPQLQVADESPWKQPDLLIAPAG
jgi:hypothetical protein